MGFPCSARTSCDRGGCPLYSGDSGARPDQGRSPASARRITSARPCTPPQPSIHTGLCITEHQPRVHACRPVRSSPRLSPPDGTAASWALPRASHPLLRAAHVGVGTGHRARTWSNALCHRPSLQSSVVLSTRATSRRTRPSRSRSTSPDTGESGPSHALAHVSIRSHVFGGSTMPAWAPDDRLVSRVRARSR